MTFSESDSASAKVIFDKIDWSYEGEDILAYRHDCSTQSVKCGAALNVSDGKVAVVFYDSDTFDIFLPGEYILNTAILKKAANVFGHELTQDEPFICDVCYVDIMPRENLDWESKDSIWVLDEAGRYTGMTGKGRYGFRMSNPEVFLRKVFGREKSLTSEKFTAQLENLIIAGVSGILSEYKVDINMLREEKKAVVSFIGAKLREKLVEYGFVLIDFTVDEFAVLNEPEDNIDNTEIVSGIVSDDSKAEQVQPSDSQNESIVKEDADGESVAEDNSDEESIAVEYAIEQAVVEEDVVDNPIAKKDSADDTVFSDNEQIIAEASVYDTVNAEQNNSSDVLSSFDDDSFSFSFEESSNTIEEFEIPEQKDGFDKLDFKLEIPDFDLDFLNVDEFISGAAAESSSDETQDLVSSAAKEDVSELDIDSIPFADEAIVRNGGSLKLDSEIMAIMSDNLTGAKSQKSDDTNITMQWEIPGADVTEQNDEVRSDSVADFSSIIDFTGSQSESEDPYSPFSNCPNCGKSVLKGMSCPECGTDVK